MGPGVVGKGVPLTESFEPIDDAELDVSVVLPVYNEKGHLRQEIDRIRAALEASPYTYEIIVVDDGSDRRLGRGSCGDRGHPADPVRAEPRLGLGPQGRHRTPRGDASPCGPTST